MKTSFITKVISPVVFIGFIASLAGLLFGLGLGGISGAEASLQRDFQISDQLIEIIVSSLLWGAVFGTLITGTISHRWGRKKTLLLSASIFLIGALLCAFSPSPTMVIAARFIFGLSIGIATFIAPVYLSEISPQKIRGFMISIYLLVVAIGVVTAFLTNTLISYWVLNSTTHCAAWRLMLGTPALAGLMAFLSMCFLPESPRWLFLKGFQEEGMRVFKKMGLSEEEALQEQINIKKALLNKQNGFLLFKTSSPFRHVVALGISLAVIQQFTGISMIFYYAPRIFKMAGFVADSEQLWGTVLLGVVNVLATFIAINFVDRLGRKPMMYIGLTMMGVSLAVVGCCLKKDLHQFPLLGLYTIGALVFCIIGFGMSVGPVIWTLCSEIFPLAGRDLGVTFSTSANWISNAVVGSTFLTMVNKLGSGNTFLCYGSFQIISLLIFFLFVPETKDVSLETIEENLFSGLPLRKIGQN